METAFVSLIAYATHTLTAWIVIVIILVNARWAEDVVS